MFRTTIALLGAPRIEHDGVPVEVDTRKAIALAAYLAVTKQSHTRDALAGLLWPEYNQSRARAALRRTLSSLGKARAEGWLRADRDSVELANDAIRVDVTRFHDLLEECKGHGHPESEVCPECMPPLTEAVTLYRDDFMAGFGLRDSVAFDDWQFFQSESLRRELAGALERLARGRGALGEWEAAIVHARRRLAMDTLHEPAHRLLMALYAWSDQRAAALRQYRECVRVLGQELSVAPLEETTLLYRAIQENYLPPRPALAEYRSPARREPGASTELPVEKTRDVPRSPDNPLVGRDPEWEALLGSYRSVGDGGHVVVVEGEAGIGKTRLAEEFVANVSAAGATAVTARCYAGEKNLAYGPFVEGLSATLGRGGTDRLKGMPTGSLQEAARLLPDLSPDSPPAPPLDTPGARSRFFGEVVRVLLKVLGGPPPGVLFLDDLHWADDASLSLLTYLVRRLDDKPLFVLLTWRTEEGHRLRELLAETRRSGRSMTLTLERLGQASVEELVGHALPGAGMLGSRLSDETEGLPLFLTEYLTAIEKGGLDPGDEAWTLPGGVQDLLRTRLLTVGETAGQVLAAAAVVGRSFDFDTVRAASGRSEEETLAAIEELTSRGLIREVGSAVGGAPAYDFDHDKLRTLVYEETSLARKRLLHRRAAVALAAQARGREVDSLAGQIARHHRLAGQDQAAAQYHRLAGDYARSLHANSDAITHYEEALALGHPDATTLHEAIGDLRTRAGEYGAALSSYEAAASSADQGGLSILEHKIGNVHARRGERDLARSHYESALEALGEPEGGAAGWLARLYADWSLLSHGQDDRDEATGFASRALELAEGTDDTRSLAQAHNMLGILAGKSGDQNAALRHLEESLDLAEALGDSDAKVAALNNLALAREHGGEPDEALRLAETALALCIASGDRHREAALHNNLADMLHAVGREQESMAHLKRAVELFAEIGERDELQPEIWKLVEW